MLTISEIMRLHIPWQISVLTLWLLALCNWEIGVMGQPGYKGHLTDTLTSAGDNTRSGYMDNHNMDPEVLKAGTFGNIWRKKMLGDYMGFNEQFYAQPLVFTPNGHDQRVYVISQMNNAYILDAVNGTILKHRKLLLPFLTKDLEGCNDISDCVGSTSTGVIDPETGTWYVTTKSYADQTKPGIAQGLAAGRFLVHALDTLTLEDKPGFPVTLDGLTADNAPWRMFEGGKHNQRPALMHVGNWVYAGFGSHCVQWNFTGWIIGWHKTTGDIVAKYAMEGGKETTRGIGGGIWMSGGGLASDNPGRMFFATGNGYASQLADDPVPGRSPPTALEEAVVNMAINDDGSITPIDFFMPWEKRELDAMDQDLGTSGFVLLPPAVFSTATVKRVGCIGAKSGKLYCLNMEDLGGYQMGPARKDKVLQTILMPGPIFSSVGVYPLEGGYMYATPVGKQTIAYKFGKTAGDIPVFTQAGVTTHSAAGRQGVGHVTVTSNKGAPGSGILWTVDVEGTTLRAYGTVPVGGILPNLLLANNPGQSKFSRPAFGDGRLYLTTTTGYITAFGSPVNTPFNCSSPYDAGSVVIGQNSTTEITCTAKIPLTVDSIKVQDTTSTQFILSNLPTYPVELKTGENIKFAVIFKPTTVGPLSSSVNVKTTNRGPGDPTSYANITPVLIRGVARSILPILVIQPDVLAFGELITGTPEGSVLDFSLENIGESPLVIGGYAWSITGPGTPPFLTPNPTARDDYVVGPYTFSGLPRIGTSIPGNNKTSVKVTFFPKADGYFQLYLSISSNTSPPGTVKTVGAFGKSGGPPSARFSWQTPSSSKWQDYTATSPPLEFNPSPFLGTTSPIHLLRLSNTGGTTLTITISKPPTTGILVALNGLGSLPEGAQLAPNTSMDAQLICSPPKGQVNVDPANYTAGWTFNTNDPTMGKLKVEFLCTAVSRQLGPPSSKISGRSRYRYLGCYKDSNPRSMEVQLYYSQDNENGKCQRDCLSRGWRYAATQYEGECWCGSKLPDPSAKVPIEEESRCNYLCKGDYTQYCGGDGSYLSLFGDEELGLPSPSPTGSPTSPAPGPSGTGTPSPSPYVYLGCVLEPTNPPAPPGSRALPDAYFASHDRMTNQACQKFCSDKSYKLAGTEYGVECWCGGKLENGAKMADEVSGRSRCNVPCSGGMGVMCGGANALSVWKNTRIA